MAKMKTDELESLLSAYQHSAVGAMGSSVSKSRADLMERYTARPYGDEVDGRSSVVDTTVRDTVESIKPELLDIFLGGDRAVEFTPVGDEDVAAAKQETDVCNHIFLQKNNGFMVLYDWFTDALVQKNGYIKRYWDERKRVEIEEYEDLSPDEAQQLLAEIESTSDKVEFLERSGGLDEETGEIEPLSVKIKLTTTERDYKVEAVPAEEILVSPQWKSVFLAGCPFVAHRPQLTASDLIEMGFDKKEIDELPEHVVQLRTEEGQTRFGIDQDAETALNRKNPAMRNVLVYENYIRVDRDGDGVAEMLQIFTGGENGKILKRKGRLAIEQVADAPFEVLSSLPIPHKHYGMCVAELVEDLQKIKTVLTRQLLDNVVGSNSPDVVVDEKAANADTITALEQTGMGRIIPVEGPNAVTPLPIPQTAGQSLQAIEYVDSLKEARTGVTRYNQGMDADSLNKTASGVRQIMSASQKRILMIARIFAETGFKSLFQNMHRDLRAGPLKQLAVKMNDQFVTVNPRTWRSRTDMVANVGLGTGDRDIQITRLMQILAEQKEGLASGVVTYQEIYQTYKRILELSGFKDTSSFFKSPEAVSQQPPQESQPDPGMVLAQIEAQKNQAQAMAKQAELELKKLEMLMKDDRERDLAAAKIEADEAARLEARVDGQALVQN